jgi:adenine-specific DNA-methyltransferase
MSTGPSFVLDINFEFYTIAPGNIITGKYLEYLIACLNSQIFYFALRKYYMGGGIEGELKTNRLLILPIPIPSTIPFEYVQRIEKLSSELTKNTSNNERFSLQKSIDSILATILNLSEEEYKYIIEFEF